MLNLNITTYQPTATNKVADRIHTTSIPGLLYIENTLFADNRGFYKELSIIPDIDKVIGFEFIVKQVSHARSEKNVIRGFHAEDWNKLVTVTSGTAFCALADIRPDSSTFGNVETFLLGDSNGALFGSVYISKGIANSICVVDAPVDYVYYVDALYRDRDKKNDRAISLFDPSLNVSWPIPKDELLYSDRDKDAISLRELFPDKF